MWDGDVGRWWGVIEVVWGGGERRKQGRGTGECEESRGGSCGGVVVFGGWGRLRLIGGEGG